MWKSSAVMDWLLVRSHDTVIRMGFRRTNRSLSQCKSSSPNRKLKKEKFLSKSQKSLKRFFYVTDCTHAKEKTSVSILRGFSFTLTWRQCSFSLGLCFLLSIKILNWIYWKLVERLKFNREKIVWTQNKNRASFSE